MDFKETMNKKTAVVNNIIYSYLPNQDTMAKIIMDAMKYSVMAGGKRIRPVIMLEVFRMCKGEDNVINPFLAAIEFIHTYSLVHDDLPAMDNDMYRRGKLTTHAKYGEDLGILTGDALLNYAFEIVLNDISKIDKMKYSHVLKALQILANKAGIMGMVGGQVVDVLLTGKEMNEEALEFVFKLKTGALIEASFMIGGILAGADEETVKKLEKAGYLVGMAFQIQDDILDVVGNEAELGKPVLSDEKNNKTTYVTLYGLQKAKEDVYNYSQEAIDIIESIGDNEFLCELIQYLINRKK